MSDHQQQPYGFYHSGSGQGYPAPQGQPGGFAMPTAQIPSFPQPGDYAPPSYPPPGYPPPSTSPYPPQPPAVGQSSFAPPPLPPSSGPLMPSATTHAPKPHGPLPYLGVPIPIQSNSNYDVKATVKKIKKATKGLGTDGEDLVEAIAKLDPRQIEALKKAYPEETGNDLFRIIQDETGSYFGMGLEGKLLGPLAWDAVLLRKTAIGAEKYDGLVHEIILGRTNEEIGLLKAEYLERYKEAGLFERDVKLGMPTKSDIATFLSLVLEGKRTPDHLPLDPALLRTDVGDLHNVFQGGTFANKLPLFNIFATRSQPHLHALIEGYKKAHKQKLKKMIKTTFSNQLEDVLLYILAGVKHFDGGVLRDAKLLEESMAGLGTKDKQLVWRIIRAHWNPTRFAAIKEAYAKKYKRSLASRVEGETSGDYRRLMLAIIG